jgi:hypothetical protein
MFPMKLWLDIFLLRLHASISSGLERLIAVTHSTSPSLLNDRVTEHGL